MLLAALEAEGIVIVSLLKPLRRRCPSIHTCAARSLSHTVLSALGFIGWPSPTAALALAPLLAAGAYALASRRAAPPLQALRSRVAGCGIAALFDTTTHGETRRLAPADLEPSLDSADAFAVYGMEIALCPLGGRDITKSSVSLW